ARAESLREEMAAHLALAAEDVGSRDAVQSFGNATAYAESSREVWVARWLQDLFQDLRYSVRNIRKDPGYAAVAALSSTLGIAACTTIFGIANFAMNRNLPVTGHELLVAINGREDGQSGHTLSFPEVEDLRQARSLDGAAAFFPLLAAAISSDGETRRYWGSILSANYFDVVKPAFAAGGGFDVRIDDKLGAAPAVVLGHALWRARFHSDRSIVGRTIELNKKQVRVVGVAGPGFQGTELAFVSDFWLPMSMIREVEPLDPEGVLRRLSSRDSQWLFAVARRNVPLEQVRAELALVAKRNNGTRDFNYAIETAGRLNPGIREAASVFFALVFGVCGLVLLLACANVANLLLARGEARQKEIATRLAIGAGRGRLVRQLLTESVLLALLGGPAGLLLAVAAAEKIGAIRMPMDVPIDLTISLDWRVAAFCLALCVVTGLLFGIVPALRASRADLVPALKQDGHLSSFRRFGLRNGLVVAQVAVSLLLLIGSALFLRSLAATQNADSGYANRGQIAMMAFDPVLQGLPSGQTTAMARAALERVRSAPGVRTAALSDIVPLSLGANSNRVLPDHKFGSEASQGIRANFMNTSSGYFAAMGLPILDGADFRDTVDGEIVINQVLAEKAFGRERAVGRRVRVSGTEFLVTGVAANGKSRFLNEEPQAIAYTPVFGRMKTDRMLLGVTVIAHVEGDPNRMIAPIREALRRGEASLPVFDERTFEGHMTNAMFFPRVAGALFGICGLFGLIIASIGVYGVISYGVSRRGREIGIRLALGARRGQVVQMVLREGLALALIGSAIGLAGGIGFGKLARTLLYGVGSADPVAYFGVPVFLLVVAAIATLVPATRAARVDPNTALRCE
ncbi:MAG: ABC transporter permease, partial [Acidobacteria bacterium]|nr:ABC transporter permease [Acidobacteriota bacterium]